MMVHCRNYDVAKLEAISFLSYFDNNPTSVSIYYDKQTYSWVVDCEEFDEDALTDLLNKNAFK